MYELLLPRSVNILQVLFKVIIQSFNGPLDIFFTAQTLQVHDLSLLQLNKYYNKLLKAF